MNEVVYEIITCVIVLAMIVTLLALMWAMFFDIVKDAKDKDR